MSEKITIYPEDIYKGHLLLINHDYPIQNIIDEKRLDKLAYKNNLLLIDSVVKSNLLKIFAHIQSDNKILCTDAYRSHQMQKDLYNKSLIENGKEFTESYVAKVDCSEHQSALAVDLAINSRNIDLIRPSFPNVGISKNFKEVAAYYGFIERYKEDKVEITKISAEEWHFRYVSYPHSKIISDLNLALEEYIDLLKDFNKKDPLLFEDYRIYYLKYEENLVLNIDNDYMISGNNVDGVIITEYAYEKN